MFKSKKYELLERVHYELQTKDSSFYIDLNNSHSVREAVSKSINDKILAAISTILDDVYSQDDFERDLTLK